MDGYSIIAPKQQCAKSFFEHFGILESTVYVKILGKTQIIIINDNNSNSDNLGGRRSTFQLYLAWNFVKYLWVIGCIPLLDN